MCINLCDQLLSNAIVRNLFLRATDYSSISVGKMDKHAPQLQTVQTVRNDSSPTSTILDSNINFQQPLQTRISHQ